MARAWTFLSTSALGLRNWTFDIINLYLANLKIFKFEGSQALCCLLPTPPPKLAALHPHHIKNVVPASGIIKFDLNVDRITNGRGRAQAQESQPGEGAGVGSQGQGQYLSVYLEKFTKTITDTINSIKQEPKKQL